MGRLTFTVLTQVSSRPASENLRNYSCDVCGQRLINVAIVFAPATKRSILTVTAPVNAHCSTTTSPMTTGECALSFAETLLCQILTDRNTVIFDIKEFVHTVIYNTSP